MRLGLESLDLLSPDVGPVQLGDGLVAVGLVLEVDEHVGGVLAGRLDLMEPSRGGAKKLQCRTQKIDHIHVGKVHPNYLPILNKLFDVTEAQKAGYTVDLSTWQSSLI